MADGGVPFTRACVRSGAAARGPPAGPQNADLSASKPPPRNFKRLFAAILVAISAFLLASPATPEEEGDPPKLTVPEWLKHFRLSLGGSNQDAGFAAPEVQGLIPLASGLLDGENLLGLHLAGSWAKTANGDNLLEGAAGVVLNALLAPDWMGQFGLLYQHRHDTREGLDFRLLGGTVAVQFGRGRLSLYGGLPISGRQKVKVEDRSTSSTSSTTSSGNTTTTTTGLSTHIDKYKEARKAVSLMAEAEILDGLRLSVGGAWYGGIPGHVRDRSGVKETKEDIEEERRGLVGARYTWPWLSAMLRQQTDLHVEARVGEGKPEFSGGLTVHLGAPWQKGEAAAARKPDLLTPPRIERIHVATYRVLKETTSRSPSISSTCPTTGTVGVAYSCTVSFSGSEATLVTAPSFLSITASTATSATISGTPAASHVGSHTVRLRVRNTATNLDSFLEYTLTISAAANNAPTVTMDSPAGNVTIDAGDFVNFQSTASDPDGDALTFDWTITTVAGGPAPSINDVEDPGAVTFLNAGTYDVTVSVSDGKGGTATSATRRITVSLGAPLG